MATRVVRTPETVDEHGNPVPDGDMIPAGDPPAPVLSAVEKEEESLVERIRAVVRGVTSDRLRVKIYRANGPGAGEQMDELHPQEFDTLEFHEMRTRWGSGEFEVRVFGDKGIITRGRMKIAAPLPGAVVHASQQNSELAQVLRMMADGQAQILRALTEKPPAPDPQAQMRQTLELLTMVKALTGDKPAAVEPMTMFREMMGAAREMKEFQKEIADPNPSQIDDDDSIGGIIKSMAPVLQAALSNQPAQQPAPAGFPPLQPMQLPPSIENGAHFSQQPPKGEDMANPVQQQTPAQLLMLGIIEDLCDMAKAGKSPVEGAEYALDSLPDDALPVLRNRYGVQVLQMQFPVISPHKEWFESVRKEAVRLMDEPEPGELDADGNPVP